MRTRAYGLLSVGLAVTIAVLAGTSMPSGAGGRVFIGVGVGVPLWYPYPYPYIYPYPAYSPPVVVEQPPLYVESESQAPPQPQYRYYCRSAEAYYPYVRECPDGWMEVVHKRAPSFSRQEPPAERLTTVEGPGRPADTLLGSSA